MTFPASSSPLRTALRATLVVAAGLLSAGASCGQTRIVEAQLDPEGHRMVVMPMKDRLNYHFDSMRGVGLARSVTERLLEQRKEDGDLVMDVVPFEDLEAEVGKVHKDPKDFTPADIGRMMKADLVLIGNIEQFESRIPGDVGISRGRAKVTIKVVETAKPERSMLTRTIDLKYPDEKLTSSGVLMTADASPEAIEAGLMKSLADKIAKLFYEYEEKVRQ